VAASARITGCAVQSAAPPASELRAMAQQMFGTVEPARDAEIAAPRAALGRALFWDTRPSIDHRPAAGRHVAAEVQRRQGALGRHRLQGDRSGALRGDEGRSRSVLESRTGTPPAHYAPPR
jgi:cytochrome c peroxidase